MEKKKYLPFAIITIILVIPTIYSINSNVQMQRQYNELVDKYNDLLDSYNELMHYLIKDKTAFTVGASISIHMTIRIWKGNELILDEYHAGAVTDIGDNMTCAWVFGDSAYNVSSYMKNATYISIGNQGTLTTSSTNLPGEWNRTLGTVEDQTQSQLNLTCTFYPDSGPYTADCIGINWEAAGDLSLYAYDTFTEVTGIDNTFTINVEFQIAFSHS